MKRNTLGAFRNHHKETLVIYNLYMLIKTQRNKMELS